MCIHTGPFILYYLVVNKNKQTTAGAGQQFRSRGGKKRSGRQRAQQKEERQKEKTDKTKCRRDRMDHDARERIKILNEKGILDISGAGFHTTTEFAADNLF